MKNINVYASDLAVALGINKYQKISDLIIKLWQKNFPIDYQNTITDFQDKYKVEFKIKKDDLEYVKILAKEHKLEIDDELNNCIKLDDTNKLHEGRNKMIKIINDNETIDDKTKEHIKQSLIGATNRNFGTINEKSVIDLYSEKYKKKVIVSAKYVKKLICEYKDYKWYLGGKIDGITDDFTVIEIKNRIYKLFNEMKDYEKPQLYAYMYINQLEKGHLVECHKSNGKMDLNMIEEQFDAKYWEEIINKFKKFIKLFHLFIEDNNLKIFILLADENQREEILYKYMDK